MKLGLYKTMKLDLCVVACNLNDDYMQFFDIVKYSWKHYVGIETKFILISSYIPENLLHFKDDIILFKPIKDIPTAFQAQCVRLLYPSLMNEVKNSIIVSDMDLIPLNNNFYTEPIKNVDGNNFIVYRNVISEHLQYPICFCAANSETWSDIFSIKTILDINNKIECWYEYYINSGHFYQISSPYSVIWACDQLKLFEYVNKWNEKTMRLTYFTDEETKFNRLDRHNILDIDKNFQEYKVKIKFGVYSDFHLPRISSYKKLINRLLF
jgi:hypothetical protein